MKLWAGAGSTNVCLVQSRAEAEDLDTPLV